jgi:hypothetical protein
MKLKTIYSPDKRKVNVFLKRSFPWWLLVLLLAIIIALYFVCLHTNTSDYTNTTKEDDIDIEERLEEVNASKGEITISLGWNNSNDLDLHVITPCGDTINYYHLDERVCGGIMEYDRNADDYNISSRPFEHIYWEEGNAFEGQYEVIIHNYEQREQSRYTNYELNVIIDGNKKTYTGKIGGKDEIVEVTEFNYRIN